MRQIYNKFDNPKLKQHCHVRVDMDLRLDCLTWMKFSKDDSNICRPFMDFSEILIEEKMEFFTDVSKAHHLGLECYFDSHWISKMWAEGFNA